MTWFAVSLSNPALASRPCDLCRQIMFDEETGMPYESKPGSKTKYDARVGKVPCETSIGCKKGHWKDKPDLNPSQEAVIDLFYSSRATGGAFLSRAERRDWWLLTIFARLQAISEANERSASSSLLSCITAMQTGAVNG